MARLRPLLRWLLHGESNVTATLDSLSGDVRELQRRLDEIQAGPSVAFTAAGSEPWPISAERSHHGVNVVGYLQHQLAIGDFGRRMCDVLTAGTIPISPIAFGATQSPPILDVFPVTQSVDYATTIAVVAADQLPVLERDHPEIFAASDRTVGYCFWELSTLSEQGARGAELVDEVWACTSFIADAFRRLGTVPVRHVPIPIAEPAPSTRERASFAPLAAARDRLVFGITFDHFSVLERKNPLGAIEAFRRAFAPDSGPLLVVKTLNAALQPDEHARLESRAHDRSDIVIWDEHLSRPDQLAFISHLDVLVSLHRGEGLGMHLAEAMWLGVPVIATGYSGNVDFMDESCARLVDHTMIAVQDGGTIYPDSAEWADPDLDHAAELMVSLASDDRLRTALGSAARLRMQSQPTDDVVARRIADALGLTPS